MRDGKEEANGKRTITALLLAGVVLVIFSVAQLLMT